MSAEPGSEGLNGAMRRRLLLPSEALEWQRSPAGGVERKRFHRVGPPESGQVTSLVRYLPGARFPRHPHPAGEEILVLEGTFSDHRGDWTAGSWIASAEGFEHAPWSEPGCLILVKLRQYPGPRPTVALQTRSAEGWIEGDDGGARLALFDAPDFPDRIDLERWPAGRRMVLGAPGGIELFVVDGRLDVDGTTLPHHGFLRLPPGDSAAVSATVACTVWLKRDAVENLERMDA